MFIGTVRKNKLKNKLYSMKKFLFDKVMLLKTISRWVIFLSDMLIVSFATSMAILFRTNFKNPAIFYSNEIILIFSTVLTVKALLFLFFKTHASLLRYTGTKDILHLFWINLVGSLILTLFNGITYVINVSFIVPFSIVLLEFVISTFIIIFYRLFIKSMYAEYTVHTKGAAPVLLYGAGYLGLTTKRSIRRNNNSEYKVVGFIDDDPNKIGKKIDGLPIYSFDELPHILKFLHIAHVIIAIDRLLVERRNAITNICLEHNVKILTIPPVDKWIHGELSAKQIKEIKIEDLLGREPIKLNDEALQRELLDKTLLVTGAAGSIGGEIVRQLMKYDFKQMILVDNAESPLYFLELDLAEMKTNKHYKICIGDICDLPFMQTLFDTYQPDMVYHAAAYKHVPLMEKNPEQAIKVNIVGTKILADLSVAYQTTKFIMISTDKAVNPTSVMGASKRIAEIYVQSLGKKEPHCKFITTRFGNVLGSNGSIIPILKRQIEKGMPITITHPEVTRYFMTISEACDLVLHAGAMGNGGEIYIFDMGESMKIIDLAKKMISLSGLELDKDIQIIFTGLRPGEKLFEELLANDENTIPTEHQKIKIANVRNYDLELIEYQIAELISLLKEKDTMALVGFMKHIVPEFQSQNSIYVSLNQGEDSVSSLHPLQTPAN
jgi:FlaA1/EpsC-like NDP-sugar epimerase